VLPAAQEVPADEGSQWQAAVEPVDPDPDLMDAAALVKAVQRAEQEITKRADADRKDTETKATETKAAETATTDCGLDESGLGAVKTHVRRAAELLGCRFGEPQMHGVAGRAGTSDHPSGKAVDFMVDRSAGDGLAACALRNKDSLGITYVIWRQRINFGNGWKPMEDRGGVTANHFDHVHISFGSSGGEGTLKGC
jgi:hypothetical protein